MKLKDKVCFLTKPIGQPFDKRSHFTTDFDRSKWSSQTISQNQDQGKKPLKKDEGKNINNLLCKNGVITIVKLGMMHFNAKISKEILGTNVYLRLMQQSYHEIQPRLLEFIGVDFKNPSELNYR